MNLASQIGSALASGSILALPLSLVGGLIAGFNPCCLALYPAAAASCCVGRDSNQRPSGANAVSFVLGIAVAMAALGVAVSMAGHVTGPGTIGRYAVAAVPLIMGLDLLGWIHLPFDRLSRLRIRNGGGAFGMGLLLSLVIAPCSTPLLASVLSYAAYHGRMIYGALLLFVYGLGLGTPLLLAGTGTVRVVNWLERAGWKIWVDRSSGAALLLLGFYLLWTA